MEKSCAPNEPIDGYADKPDIPGVCNATTGVLRDDCCRCYIYVGLTVNVFENKKK